MKKRFNLITLLIICAFGLHLTAFFVEEFGDSKDSFMRGYKEGVTGVVDTDLYYLTLVPTDYAQMTDSVYNQKSESWLPARTMETVVLAPASLSRPLNMFWVFLGVLLLIAAFFLIVVCFIKLILAVNKSIIFEWVNVTRLREIGGGFITLFIVNVCIEYFYYQQAMEAIQIPDYVISNGSIIKASTLILGLVSFLVAEIFSVGLKLKEEQDLTI
ncbi:DUF2975 domain-containing protein [Parabacteroides sp. 52]|uniref:DUF2975 domain-containing protein n=1 Tax=unclassified Parabacteroides TaxID=2649774 RepID=UPI0013D50BC1|nr:MULTISPECIES: DUF2975 domain-containing protein [unclassified Parabacteroides]MDH6535487.1 hypothetical protein [Parabacteroides sp. PM5-20]NDV55933.1 DUF2975 domain-containing protein [Parabacteroides sp. 52]